MKRFFIVAFLAVFALFLITTDAGAFLGLLDKKYSVRPYDKIIINGKVRKITKITQFSTNSHYVEWKNEKGKGTYFWVEERNTNGEIVRQKSLTDSNTYKYTYGPDGKVKSVLTRIIWEESNQIAMNSHLKPCDFGTSSDCYVFQGLVLEILLTAKRDANGVITGGTMKNTFFTKGGRKFTKEQKLRVTYPKSNTMRITFEGFGEPWAHVDAWQEYRIENGKLVWEICRNFGQDICKSENK